MTAASTLKYIRLTHLYLGVFIAPALIFFAFTGALQTFSLHETTRGSSYKPPAWAVVLAQIHKKQTPVVFKRPPAPDAKPDSKSASRPAADAPDSKPRAAEAPPSAPKPADANAPAPPKHNPLPLKIFFLLVAIGLFTSTLTGLYMSYKFIRNKVLVTALLVAGTVIPLLMILL
jgi:hypothetical protein